MQSDALQEHGDSLLLLLIADIFCAFPYVRTCIELNVKLLHVVVQDLISEAPFLRLAWSASDFFSFSSFSFLPYSFPLSYIHTHLTFL